MIETPYTIEEWQIYISSLSGQDLRSKAINANTLKFINVLMEEGMELEDIELLMKFFVRRMVQLGQKIPEGGAFDLIDLFQEDPLSQEIRLSQTI